MLDLMATMIEDSPRVQALSATDDDFELNNLNCWGKELRGYSDINKQFAAMPSTNLKTALRRRSTFSPTVPRCH